MLLLFSLSQILYILKAWGIPQLAGLPPVIRALAQRNCVRSLGYKFQVFPDWLV